MRDYMLFRPRSMEAEAACSLIARLPDHLVLLCIFAPLPRAQQAKIRCVCSAWRNALQPAAITALRKTLAISEAWPVAVSQNSSGDRTWLFVDPLTRCCYRFPPLSLPHIPPWTLITASGSHLIVSDTSKSLFVLDAASMLWRSVHVASAQEHSKPSFGSKCETVAVDGYLYAAESGHVHRLDFQSSRPSWECLPDMHEPRDTWMTMVALGNGCLCAVGGFSSTKEVCSGEVWNPSIRRWTTIPNFWPLHIFIDTYHPPVAVVRERIYALRSHTREIVVFNNASRTWESLYPIPNCLVRAHSMLLHELLAVGDELWLMWIDHIDSKKEHILCVKAPTSTLTSRPHSWKILPLEFSGNIEFMKLVVFV